MSTMDAFDDYRYKFEYCIECNPIGPASARSLDQMRAPSDTSASTARQSEGARHPAVQETVDTSLAFCLTECFFCLA